MRETVECLHHLCSMLCRVIEGFAIRCCVCAIQVLLTSQLFQHASFCNLIVDHGAITRHFGQAIIMFAILVPWSASTFS